MTNGITEILVARMEQDVILDPHEFEDLVPHFDPRDKQSAQGVRKFFDIAYENPAYLLHPELLDHLRDALTRKQLKRVPSMEVRYDDAARFAWKMLPPAADNDFKLEWQEWTQIKNGEVIDLSDPKSGIIAGIRRYLFAVAESEPKTYIEFEVLQDFLSLGGGDTTLENAVTAYYDHMVSGE